MRAFVYSRWDGTEKEFSLDAEETLRAVSELMMHGLGLSEALEWMRRFGFSPEGLGFRVMGTDELLELLRNQIEELQAKYDLDDSARELEERLEDVLAREETALVREMGHESAALNAFLGKRHAGDRTLSARIERFRDHEFLDEGAGSDFRDLLSEIDELRGLEQFLEKNAGRFHGPEAASYEQAREIRRTVESLERLARGLAEGNLEEVSLEELGRFLGEDAARSLVLLRDLPRRLKDAGYAEDGEHGATLTPRAIRKIGAQALADVYDDLDRQRSGDHETGFRGAATPRPDESRPYRFGDPFHLDVTRSLMNAVLRNVRAGQGGELPLPLRLTPSDLEVRELDFATDTTTVLLLDLSWSMSFGKRFPAAKRVALALSHLIRSSYPRDRFFVVGFSTQARELGPKELSEITWDASDPFTNLQAGLVLARELISKNPSSTAQILVITDGQPTAYYLDGRLHAEWPMGPGAVSPRAVAETMKEVHRLTRRGVTINTFMLDDAPELVGFVERMTEVNRGRAFFTAPDHLGRFLLVDYVARRARRR